METNRSVTKVLRCAHHPDTRDGVYLGLKVITRAQVQLMWHDIGAMQRAVSDSMKVGEIMPGCPRLLAHLPTLPPPSASPEAPPGSSHRVSLPIPVAVGPLLASCSVCDPEETIANGPVFLHWDELIFVLLPSRDCDHFSDKTQIFTGLPKPRRQRLRPEA